MKFFGVVVIRDQLNREKQKMHENIRRVAKLNTSEKQKENFQPKSFFMPCTDAKPVLSMDEGKTGFAKVTCKYNTVFSVF